MTNNRYQCHLCGHWYDRSPEAGAQQGQNCSACLDVLSHKRGSGRDTGHSQLQHGPCSRCGSETEYFTLADGSHTMQCPQCSRTYSSSSY